MKRNLIETLMICSLLILIPAILIIQSISLHYISTGNQIQIVHDTVYINQAPIPDTIHLERATTYQPTVDQCDSDPLTTADGSRINPSNLERWVALSRDHLARWGGEFNYGDTLTIYSAKFPHLNGEWEVHDCMASRYTNSIDFLMSPEDNFPKLGVGTDVKILVCH
jgi:hypothetical protein